MEAETAVDIKNKLDSILIYSRAIYIDWKDTKYKRVYVYSVSNDRTRENITPYSKASFYLQRYKNYETNIIYYELGSVSSETMYGSNTRVLVTVNANGSISKYTSQVESNKIKFSYYAKEFGVNASVFFGATIESRQGYQFCEPNRLIGQSYGYGSTNGDFWNYCRMLGITTVPRLCCVQRSGRNTYELAVVYKESTNYIVNITGVFEITLSENSAAENLEKLFI